MKRHFTQEELQAASQDASVLRKLVKASGGYVLQKMKKAGLAPELAILMEKPHPDSVMYILDNHELTREQQKQLAPFFSMDLASARLGGGALTEQEIDDAMRSGEALSPKAELSFRQMIEFKDKITDRYDQDEFAMERIMRSSFKKLSAQEAIQLDRRTLTTHLDFWSGLPGAFESDEARALYKELAIERAKENRSKPRWSDFEKWPFKAEDKAFLTRLIAEDESYRGVHYENAQKNPSAAALLDEWEFVEKCNPWSVKHLSMKQVELHKIEIQTLWAEALKSEGVYSRLSRLASKPVASLEQFEAIVDEQMIIRLSSEGVRLDIHRMGDGEEESARELLLWVAMAKAALLDPPNALNLLSPRELGETVNGLTEGNSRVSAREQDLPLAEGLARDVLPLRLKSSCRELSDTLQERMESWKRPGVFEAMAASLLERPTPNGLFLALSVWSEESRGRARNTMRVSKKSRVLVRKLMREVDAESAQTMAAHFKAPFKTGVKARPASSPEDDFLKADYTRLHELSNGNLRLLMKVDPSFAIKAVNSGAEPDERLLLSFLRSDELPGRIEALTAWAQRCPEAFTIHPALMENIARHPDGPLFWPMDAGQRESESLSRAEEKTRELEGVISRLEAAREQIARATGSIRSNKGDEDEDHYEEDEYYDEDEDEEENEKKESDALKELRATEEVLEKKERELAKQIGAELKEVSFERMGQALDEALASDDYEWFTGLRMGAISALKESERFESRARSLTAERFIELLVSNEHFKTLIVKSMRYSGENNLNFDFGSNADNERVCEALMGAFKKDPIQALEAFKPEAAQPFSNAFVTRHFARKAFFDYRLSPRERAYSGSGKVVVARPYTHEQTLSIWDQVEARGGFFMHKDVNARAGDFVSHNFKEDWEGFRAFLKKAASRPKLYAIMSAGELLRSFSQDQELTTPRNERMSMDEGRCKILAEEFDFDTLLLGVSEILDEMSAKRNDDKFNAALARSAVDNVIWGTNWDERDPNTGATIYKSRLSEENSVKLMRLLCEKAPAIVYGTYGLGTLGFAPATFERRSADFLNDQGLDNFLFPDTAAAPNGLSFSHQMEGFGVSYLKGVIHWLIDQERHEDVEYLNWAVRHGEFKEKELSHDYSKVSGRGRSDGPLDLLRESEDEDLKKLLGIAFERLELQETLGQKATARRRSMRM